jgi:hypothetical protein
VGFVVVKAALGQVFSVYFGFPANHSTNFSIIITRGWHNRPIGGRSAEWTQLDSTPPLYQLKKKNDVTVALFYLRILQDGYIHTVIDREVYTPKMS